MNEELKRWIQESKKEVKSLKKIKIRLVKNHPVNARSVVKKLLNMFVLNVRNLYVNLVILKLLVFAKNVYLLVFLINGMVLVLIGKSN